MAEIVLTNAHITINSVDLSDHVRAVTLDYGAAIQDKTAMGNSSLSKIAGLKDWSIALEFNQDYAAGEIDATLFPLVGAAEFPVILRADAGVKSPTNPEFTGNALVESYSPISGTVGDVHTTNPTIQGTDDLTRATS